MKRTVDLDQGLEKPERSPDRVRAMHYERERIQAEGGTITSQRWVHVEGRWIIRSHYTMPDKEDQ